MPVVCAESRWFGRTRHHRHICASTDREPCSGLPVARHDAASLGAMLGASFKLVESRRQIIKRRPEPFSDSSSAALCAKRLSDATEVRSCSAYPAVDDPARACGLGRALQGGETKARILRQASSCIVRGEDSY